MATTTSRRTFVRQTAFAFAAIHAGAWTRLAAAEGETVVAPTSAGQVRGTVVEGIKIFKGIPYGGPTSGKNRFMPPTKPAPWTGTRDALAFGPAAPQSVNAAATGTGAPVENEECLVLNVFTPALGNGAKRPVMVWLHGGGFSTGSGSGRMVDGTRLARSGDAVVVTINHRLNVFGFTSLAESFGSEFTGSSAAGLLDIIAAPQWVRDNIDRFGGDPNLVTIFGQSGGGRKVATLMAMPGAKGLFHRAIIESGAVLRLTTPADAQKYTLLLLAQLDVKPGDGRALQNVPRNLLLQANAAVLAKMTDRAPGWTANSPMVDGRIPFIHGIPRRRLCRPIPSRSDHQTEERLRQTYPAGTDEAGLKQRAGSSRIDPAPVIDAYRRAHPTPARGTCTS
jgi:para-nitrobenzyl esterase